MKKVLIVAVFILGGFTMNAQTKAKAKAPVKNETTKAKEDHCAKAKDGKSCCKNEKALSALRRPAAKPLTTAKKS